MKLIIEVLGGRWDGKKFFLDSFPLSIGRSADNTVKILDDSYVSRRHCTIFENNVTLYVSDLNSKNGSYLNEEKIKQSTPLKIGDILLIGNTRLKIDSIN